LSEESLKPEVDLVFPQPAIQSVLEKEGLYEALFKFMLDEVHIWELVRDSDGKICNWKLVDANKAALHSWGKSLDEIQGKTADEIFQADAITVFLPVVEKIFKEQAPHVWEEYFHATQQTLRMISIPYGERFISCGVDVTQIRDTEKTLLEKSEQLNTALLKVIDTIAKAVESKDPYTADHQRKVSLLAEKIGTELGLEEGRLLGLRLGASIHNIGNIGIPAEILIKSRPLNDVEFNFIQNHVQLGVEIVSDIDFPWPIVDIISQHHERLNGSGYPNGLAGGEICLEAKIVAAADVYQAMISQRPYRGPLSQSDALKELIQNKGVLYDERVIDALVNIVTNNS
jgi:HD-GYP domain-containing protein (c-di-GMP phosphodiesterase class II)